MRLPLSPSGRAQQIGLDLLPVRARSRSGDTRARRARRQARLENGRITAKGQQSQTLNVTA